LFPFNPDKVLRDIPKPVTVKNLPKACEVDLCPCPDGNTAQTPITPVTPVIPSTTEALVSLQGLINQDACALD
jgi:hypothetical protein